MAEPDSALESGSGVRPTSNPLTPSLPSGQDPRKTHRRGQNTALPVGRWSGRFLRDVTSDPLHRSGLETQRRREFPGGAASLEGVAASGTNQSSLHRARARAVAAQTRGGGEQPEGPGRGAHCTSPGPGAETRHAPARLEGRPYLCGSQSGASGVGVRCEGFGSEEVAATAGPTVGAVGSVSGAREAGGLDRRYPGGETGRRQRSHPAQQGTGVQASAGGGGGGSREGCGC